MKRKEGYADRIRRLAAERGIRDRQRHWRSPASVYFTDAGGAMQFIEPDWGRWKDK